MEPEEAEALGLQVFGELRREVVWLNGAARSALPSRTLEVGEEALRRKAHTPWDIGDTSAVADDVRALFAALLGEGARAEDVFLTPSCSYAISLAARNLRARLTGERRRVLVLQDQMHSNVLPWQALCDEEGGELLVVPRPADYDWAAAVVAALERGGVAVCAVAPCHWCDGSVVDLEAIGAACRMHDVALVVDGTQWIGAAPPIDAVRIGACFVACSVHKWLLSPYGCCLCFASPPFWRAASPLEHHDRNREGAQHVECLPMDPSGRYPAAFMHGARRLDSGGRPSYILLPMLRESLQLLAGPLAAPRLSAALRRHTSHVAARAAALGFDVPPRHAPHIVGLRPAAGMPSAEAIVDSLARRPTPVLVSARLGAVRVSPHLWSTRRDVELLLEGLAEAVAAEAGAHSRL
ncbi:hypothetical protein AB1Y20_019740 [Prymnesium parvum]|uniref:Aminotransferase class V domain-containing protein n=1 Tax=Prymnesium parvum TaxID=97485 RepID=A0AB34JW01_PRYPA